MDYRIYISTFGRKVINVCGGIPIEVGAARRSDFKYDIRDDTGDSISIENEYYGELSGMYWVWKNVDIKDDDVIGFCHYNKCLNIKRRTVVKWLNENPTGIITLKPCWVRDHPVKSEVNAWISCLRDSYLEAYLKLYDENAESRGDTCRGGNMFIMRGKTFKAYCEWFFDICKNLRADIGDKPEVEAYMRRYCAFCGERMLAVYIEANKLPSLGIKRRYKKWWLPLIRSVVDTLNINRNGKVYKLLSKRFGYVSQYKGKA